SDEASVYGALTLGVRDYVRKHGFPGVVIGLSGGVDSALTLAIAVDALGKDSVQAVMMPSRYTSTMSLEDAQEQARMLGVKYSVLSIEGMFESTLAALKGEFAGRPQDATAGDRARAVRGASAGAEGLRFAAPLRGARPDPGSVHRGGPVGG